MDRKPDLFEEYLHHSNPEIRKRAENWGISIGLQDVDHLTVSPYLIELAKLNIEGKITMNEIETRLDKYQKNSTDIPQKFKNMVLPDMFLREI